MIFSEMITVYDNFTLQIFNFTIHTIILSNKERLIKVTFKTELFNKNLLPKLNNYWNYVNNHFAEMIIKGGYSITKVIKLIDKYALSSMLLLTMLMDGDRRYKLV